VRALVREFADFQVVADVDESRPPGRSFTSLLAARDAVREWRRRGGVGPARVRLADGVHRLTEPLRLGPLDSDVTYAAAPGARPVISGGVRLSGWRVERVDGAVRWTVDAPRVSGRAARFRQLVVDGQRRPRPSLPKEGWFEMADVPGASTTPNRADDMKGTDTFVSRPGDIQPWRNLADVDVVAHHYWIQERMPSDHFDPAT